MRTSLFPRLLLLALLPSVASSQEPARLSVWPGAAPGEAARYTAEDIAEGLQKNDDRYVRFCTAATIAVRPAPKDKANGTGVVVFPGGGYNVLAWKKEGLEVAEWLNGLGVSAFVLEYRVPRRDPKNPHIAPLQDAQRALRVIRSKGKTWGLDEKRLGVLGFSAGGHLSVMTALRSDERSYPKRDALDDLSARPDFVIPIYAAYLGAKGEQTKLTDLVQVTPAAPPLFTAVTHDDKLRGLHAALLYAEYRKHGVPAELHVFTKGGHGYGLRDTGRPVNQWPTLCAQWLRERSLLTKPDTAPTKTGR